MISSWLPRNNSSHFRIALLDVLGATGACEITYAHALNHCEWIYISDTTLSATGKRATLRSLCSAFSSLDSAASMILLPTGLYTARDNSRTLFEIPNRVRLLSHAVYRPVSKRVHTCCPCWCHANIVKNVIAPTMPELLQKFRECIRDEVSQIEASGCDKNWTDDLCSSSEAFWTTGFMIHNGPLCHTNWLDYLTFWPKERLSF